MGLPNKEGAYWYQFSDFPITVRKMPEWDEYKAWHAGSWYPVSTFAEGWWVGPLQKPNGKAEDAEPRPPRVESKLLRYIRLREELLTSRKLGKEDDVELLSEMGRIRGELSNSESASLRMYTLMEQQVGRWESENG